MKLQVTDIKGASSGDIEVREDVFSVPAKTALVHQVVVGYLDNKRQGTGKTKTRSEVSGGGAKPRPQKGSGRSRQGSTRSPVWVGGGRAFGPTPRSFRKNTPKKMKRLAMLSVLSDKTRQGNLLLVNNFDIENAKTKSVVKLLGALSLLVTDGVNSDLVRSAQNIDSVKTLPVQLLNALDLINKKWVVMSIDAVRKVEEIWGGVYKGENSFSSTEALDEISDTDSLNNDEVSEMDQIRFAVEEIISNE